MSAPSKSQHEVGWLCQSCGKIRGADGHDPCLGQLPGIKFACCGHGGTGQDQGYLYFENGTRLGVIVVSVEHDWKRTKAECAQVASAKSRET